MTKNVWKKAATVVLGASLVGGVFLEAPNALTTTQAQASSKIPYSQFQSDLSGLKSALSKASTSVQSNAAGSIPTNTEYAYTNNDYDRTNGEGITGYLYDLSDKMDWAERSLSDKQADLNCLVASYNVFKSRLSAGSRSQLEAQAANIQKLINSGDKDDVVGNADAGFCHGLSADLATDYGSKHSGVSKSSTKKSYISKLSVKKTSSKKYVKATGSAKLYKSAKYVRVHTYKGNGYAKLSSKHNFSKTVYAPKAKTVKVTVGNYSHGHFTSVTSTKTVHVK